MTDDERERRRDELLAEIADLKLRSDRLHAQLFALEAHRTVPANFWADLRLSLEQAADPVTMRAFERDFGDRAFATLVEGAPAPSAAVVARVAETMVAEDGFSEEEVAGVMVAVALERGMPRPAAVTATAHGIGAARRRSRRAAA